MNNTESQETPLIFKIVVMIIIVGAIFGSFMSIVDLSLVKSTSREVENLNKIINESVNIRLSNMENDISTMQSALHPGGIVDLYVNAYHFLSNSQIDLEKIVTIAQSKSGKTFFSFYITGKGNVWIGVSKSEHYIFQSEENPGLSPQMFYINSSPDVSTTYTFTVNSSTIVMSGSPKNTYILLYDKNGAKLVHMSSRIVHVSDLLKKIDKK